MNIVLQNKFPLKVKITKNLIKEGKKSLFDVTNCIGARALRKGLKVPHSPNYRWGRMNGHIHLGDDSITLKSFDLNGNKIDVMEIKEPCEIIFKVRYNG